MKERKI